jgi:hypothetical protein
VEEPGILPNSRVLSWLPPFGEAVDTVAVQFSIRTLLRSRQQRVILSFYLGRVCHPGGAAQSASSPGPPPTGNRWHDVPLLGSSIIVLCLWIMETRVVVAQPLLHANWIFRIMPLRGAAQCLPPAVDHCRF